jgi:hypothetical protein
MRRSISFQFQFFLNRFLLSFSRHSHVSPPAVFNVYCSRHGQGSRSAGCNCCVQVFSSHAHYPPQMMQLAFDVITRSNVYMCIYIYKPRSVFTSRLFHLLKFSSCTPTHRSLTNRRCCWLLISQATATSCRRHAASCRSAWGSACSSSPEQQF